MKIAKYAAAAFAASLSLLATSCPSPLSYYIQQQNRAVDSGAAEPEPEPDYGSSGSVLPALPSGMFNAFEIILKDGAIAEPAHDGKAKAQVSSKLGGGTEANYAFSSDTFNDWKLIASFTADNVSQMKYEGTTTWTEDGNWQKYNGANSSAKGYTISKMTYYRTVGKNPYNLYKNETYPLYGADGNKTGQTESLMKRFIFYRFTGSVPVAGVLNNPLVAVDTYSKLVFAYARPTGFSGLGVPTGWTPIDRANDAKTDSTGRKYRFYEYDPAGYVTSDGQFHLTSEYEAALKGANYIPEATGKSPYQNCGGSVESPLGSLTVKAKYLKNVSVTDGWWSDPEFVWDVRSRAYSGTDTPSWDSLAKQIDNFYYNITKGTTHAFTTDTSKKETESKQEYSFSGSGPHKLELDSLVVELNGSISVKESINRKITWHEKPVIYFEYDETAKRWKLSNPATNNQFNYGAVTFDNAFTLSNGETKDFVITLPSSSNEKMELCYELSWKAAQ